MRSPTKKRARRVGRPASERGEDVRASLIEAASQLFVKHGFDRVTARQIAAGARTTPAMIHYYFGNKLGLFRAILEHITQPMREFLSAAGSERANEVELPQIIAMHMRTIAAHAWIPNVIINEVLADRGKFRSTFMREIAGPQLQLLVRGFEHGKATGRFKATLEPRYAALTLLSLCVFPFLSRPVTWPLLELKLEGPELERFIQHTTDTFLAGISAMQSPEA